ncbi:MAG: M23 family metallopeptidase [Lewinellaceae bacterium]|nr:M23 family metallopeptidase [Lewinella sp.]MCB9281207.1 M23 family metallopeptidase [Lewinellaceae bacterium]
MDKQGFWKRLQERLQHTYRLVVMNNETFQEVGSYKLNLLNLYILLSSFAVVFAVVIWMLIAYTPLHKYMPGYGKGSNNEEVQGLLRKVDNLEKELTTYRVYSESIRKVLVGDVTTEDDVPKANPVIQDTLGAMSLDPSQEEVALREEVELDEIGEIAREPRTTNLPGANARLEQMYFTPPVNGEISADFMPDKKHYGVDILAAKNTPIKAAMDGYVFLSDWTLETGNTIGIQHANNTITFYKHNSELLKKAGSYVKAGEAVAIIGNTGTMSNGPHLHFELWYKGKPVNPTEYIDF